MPEPAERTRTATSRGDLWVVSAPSGAGKTSLVRALLARDPRLAFSISYTTRPPRRSERDGHDYYFVDEETFRAMSGRGEFLEHAHVFDRWYGTGRAHVEALLASGRSVLLEIDWQGARQVRERAPYSRGIFILPPSVAELERRLRGRGTDSEETIARRLRDALADMAHWPEFDHVVVNDDFEAALARLAGIVAGAEQGCRTSLPAVRAAAETIVAGSGPPPAVH
jgi:guanylate kinase